MKCGLPVSLTERLRKTGLASAQWLAVPMPGASLRAGFPWAWVPAIEVFQNGERLVIRAELPGLAKEDIRLEIARDKMLIEGERREEHENQEDDFFHSERSYGSFFRAIHTARRCSDQQGRGDLPQWHSRDHDASAILGQQKTESRRLEVK